MNRNRKRLVSAAMAAAMVLGSCMTAGANGAVTSNEVSEREARNSDVSMNLATQGMVLLQNKNNVLPMAAQGNVAVFGKRRHRFR